MTLHEQPQLFKELVSRTAKAFEFDESHVEKDYWISKMLKEVAESGYGEYAYFKGGTSLLKVYNIISRFSEDLDLYVYTGNCNSSRQTEKTQLRNVSKVLENQNASIYVPDKSKITGLFRMLSFKYPGFFEPIGLKDGLKVELTCTNLEDKTHLYLPGDTRQTEPFIATYLKNVGKNDIVTQFGMERFSLLCVNPKRTLCDKISRLARLSNIEYAVPAVAGHIRDLYDLTLLCTLPEYIEFLQSEEFFKAMSFVSYEDTINKKNYPKVPLYQTRAFSQTKQFFSQEQIVNAYNINLRELVFNETNMPPMEQCMEVVKTIASHLAAFEDYKRQMAQSEKSKE